MIMMMMKIQKMMYLPNKNKMIQILKKNNKIWAIQVMSKKMKNKIKIMMIHL